MYLLFTQCLMRSSVHLQFIFRFWISFYFLRKILFVHMHFLLYSIKIITWRWIQVKLWTKERSGPHNMLRLCIHESEARNALKVLVLVLPQSMLNTSCQGRPTTPSNPLRWNRDISRLRRNYVEMACETRIVYVRKIKSGNILSSTSKYSGNRIDTSGCLQSNFLCKDGCLQSNGFLYKDYLKKKKKRENHNI